MRGGAAAKRITQRYDAWQRERRALQEIRSRIVTDEGRRRVEAKMLQDYLRVIPEATPLFQTQLIPAVKETLADGTEIIKKQAYYKAGNRVHLVATTLSAPMGEPIWSMSLWSYDENNIPPNLSLEEVKKRGRVIMMYGEKGHHPATFIYYGRHKGKNRAIERQYRFWETSWTEQDETQHWTRDIFALIFRHLSPTDVLNARLVDKCWKIMAERPTYWADVMARIHNAFGIVYAWVDLPLYIQFARYSLHGIAGDYWTRFNDRGNLRLDRVQDVFYQFEDTQKGYEPMFQLLGCAVASTCFPELVLDALYVQNHSQLPMQLPMTKYSTRREKKNSKGETRTTVGLAWADRKSKTDFESNTVATKMVIVLNSGYRYDSDTALVWVSEKGQLFVAQPNTTRGYSIHRTAPLIQKLMRRYLDRFFRDDPTLFSPLLQRVDFDEPDAAEPTAKKARVNE